MCTAVQAVLLLAIFLRICSKGDCLCGRFCEALQGDRRADEAQSPEQRGGECGRRCARRRREGNGLDVWFGIQRAWFPLLLRGQERRAGVSDLLRGVR